MIEPEDRARHVERLLWAHRCAGWRSRPSAAELLRLRRENRPC